MQLRRRLLPGARQREAARLGRRLGAAQPAAVVPGARHVRPSPAATPNTVPA